MQAHEQPSAACMSAVTRVCRTKYFANPPALQTTIIRQAPRSRPLRQAGALLFSPN